jgi:hypothetical protein
VPNDRPRSLGGYIEAIVTVLASDDAFATARLRHVAARRRARVILDDEAAEVRFDEGELRVETADSGRNVDGVGQTDRRTVLDLLAGRLEASAAILDGLIKVEGTPDAVAAMLLIIEIVLDAAPRSPALQMLADEFVNDRSSRQAYAPGAGSRPQLTTWYPVTGAPAEDRVLARLDLLPDGLSPGGSLGGPPGGSPDGEG